MFCRKCGNKLNDNAVFCDQCGVKIEKDNEECVIDIEEDSHAIDQLIEAEKEIINEEVVINKPVSERGPWKAFANVGNILGIVSLATMWIPFLVCCALGLYGIIFSGLGVRSASQNKKAKAGLAKSIVATVINFVLTIVIYAIILFALAY